MVAVAAPAFARCLVRATFFLSISACDLEPGASPLYVVRCKGTEHGRSDL